MTEGEIQPCVAIGHHEGGDPVLAHHAHVVRGEGAELLRGLGHHQPRPRHHDTGHQPQGPHPDAVMSQIWNKIEL